MRRSTCWQLSSACASTEVDVQSLTNSAPRPVGRVGEAGRCALCTRPGHRLSVAASDETLALLAKAVTAERHCCEFVRFQITVEPRAGPVTLELTGPEGTREFLAALLNRDHQHRRLHHRGFPGDRRLLCVLGLASPRAIRRNRSARHHQPVRVCLRVDAGHFFAGRAYAAYGGIILRPRLVGCGWSSDNGQPGPTCSALLWP